MAIVPINVLVASIAVCSVYNTVAPQGQQAAFAAEQARAGCQLILISNVYNLTRLHTLAQLRLRYAR